MRNDLLPNLRRIRESSTARWRHHGAVSARLAIGILVICLGAIRLLDNLELIDSQAPLHYFWPAAFFAIGISTLIAPDVRVDRRWAYVWLFLGAWTLANQAGWIHFGFWDVAFPLLLLFLGARLVQRALNQGSGDGSGDPANSQGAPGGPSQRRIFALLSGSEVRSFTQPIRDTEATAILSGIKLDLTSAQIEGERATLQVTAVMGGIEIYAPSDWTIVSDVLPILGAYVDKRRPTATVPTKTLFISGVVVMGGVEVKN